MVIMHNKCHDCACITPFLFKDVCYKKSWLNRKYESNQFMASILRERREFLNINLYTFKTYKIIKKKNV